MIGWATILGRTLVARNRFTSSQQNQDQLRYVTTNDAGTVVDMGTWNSTTDTLRPDWFDEYSCVRLAE